MIADITGSASLYQRLDALEAGRAIDRCITRMTRSLEAHQGKLLQAVGDELLAIFPSPDSACHAAIEIHQRIADLPPVSGQRLRIRVALHEGDGTHQPSEASVGTLLRLGGLAKADQILCSAPVVAALSLSPTMPVRARTDLDGLHEAEAEIPVFEIPWLMPHETPASLRGIPDSDHVPLNHRMRLRYLGKVYPIDDRSPVISIGRDPSCALLVQNRKVSRFHARLERRPEGYYLVDTSTNGSFLSMQGRQEIMIHKQEILLEGHGILCFGSSASDPAADKVRFDYF